MAITINESGGYLGVITGKVVGTGAAINVSLGFIPSKVIIENVTNPSKHVWQKGMAAASCIQEATNGTKSIVSSNGISEYAGAVPLYAPGFTIGTDAVLNTADDVLYFTAFR